MIQKVLSFITCLFISCIPETSEAGKFVEIPDNQVQEVYEAPKNYKETNTNTQTCVEKYYSASITGTGVEAKKAYQGYGECMLKLHNKQAMPKDIACEQKDGKFNIKLQLNRDFLDRNRFDEISVVGFHVLGKKLYYEVQVIHFGAMGGNIAFYETEV